MDVLVTDVAYLNAIVLQGLVIYEMPVHLHSY